MQIKKGFNHSPNLIHICMCICYIYYYMLYGVQRGGGGINGPHRAAIALKAHEIFKIVINNLPIITAIFL